MTKLEWKKGDGKDLKVGDIYLVDTNDGGIAKLPNQFLPSRTLDIDAESALAEDIGKRYLEELKEGCIMYFIKTGLTDKPRADFRLTYDPDYEDNPFYYDCAEYEERVLFACIFNGEYEEYRNGTPKIDGTYMTTSKYDVF